MNTFNKKSLYAAVAGLSALGVTGAANAVSVNPDGLGQALIYPYYTVREQPAGSPYNSLLSVVNSTASAKAVKVRFLEGKNSREVLDFNLYLSPKDVWTAAVIPTADGAGIFTTDQSCTVPLVSSSAASPTPFVNFAYVGDTGGDTLDRTREGYVEIIEMGDVIGTTRTAITHVNGVPPARPNCALEPQAGNDTIAGSGGLFGTMTLINVLGGTDYAVDAIALDAFSRTALWTPANSVTPDLSAVNPKTSVVTSGATTFVTDWTTTACPGGCFAIDPVSAVLMHNNVYNEYVLDAATRSTTDWVITMPTKRFYYSSNAVQKLFQRNFNNGACDDIVVTQYDREERTIVSQTSFSPPPPQGVDQLCWEANVLSFAASAPTVSSVFGSKNFNTIGTTFANGWAAINFNGSSVPTGRHQLIGGSSVTFNTTSGVGGTLNATTFNGLPTIGFAAITFSNGTLTGAGGASVLSNYGGNVNHKNTRDVR
jgi:hypothetical protein